MIGARLSYFPCLTKQPLLAFTIEATKTGEHILRWGVGRDCMEVVPKHSCAGKILRVAEKVNTELNVQPTCIV